VFSNTIKSVSTVERKVKDPKRKKRVSGAVVVSVPDAMEVWCPGVVTG